MKIFALVLVAVVGSWAAPQDGGYGYQAPSQPVPQYADTPAQYNFQWDINDQYSGNFYGHQEQRDGDNTQGSYYVQLPDSRLLRVEYYVDQYGYHPTITYEGEAQYPEPQQYSQPAPAPSQVYVQPAPAPAPQQTYQQPAPAPQQFYSQPGK